MAPSRTSTGPSPVQSVGRSLDLLEAVAAEEAGLVALAERTGLLPSTAYRLLATLVDRGYVARSEETGRYRISHKVVEVAATAGRGMDQLRTAARPHLRHLRDVTDETANLVVRDGLVVVYVDQVESSQAVRMFTTIGRRVPLHASATGKAMLAHDGGELVDEVTAGGLDRYTAQTLTTTTALAADLELTRRRGYAISNEEYEAGVVCVAAAITGSSGAILGATSVSGLAPRMRQADLDALGDAVQTHALRISREVGTLG